MLVFYFTFKCNIMMAKLIFSTLVSYFCECVCVFAPNSRELFSNPISKSKALLSSMTKCVYKVANEGVPEKML